VIRLWRITRKAYRGGAFTGTRSASSGGRWNGIGRRAVYCSLSPALATLEILVNTQITRLPNDYVIVPVDVPESTTRQVIDTAGLPPDWQQPGNQYCKELGDAWYSANRTLLLDVPSAVIPLERNIVINPRHPAFEDIDTSHVGYPLHFDPRLVALLYCE